MYVQTTDRAPKGRIISIDLARPARENWREIVSQQPEPIESSRIVGQALSPANSSSGHIAVSYLKDAASQVKLFALDGKPVKTVSLPGLGTVVFEPGLTTDSEAFFGFAGYTAPMGMYRLDAAGAVTPVRQSKLSFDPSRFETEQVFYPSKDGTRIPMFLVHRKGIVKDGKNPTLLYGYGGFNVSTTPAFSPSIVAWMEMGGIWASANLRGGAEYGDDWHDAGKRAKKQNVFDDFIAAGEYLVREKYTSTPKLAIFGGSNGGLLVGAVLNQRPDLFGAAMPAVGVMDMLRFHKFTVGALWVDEYGSPDNADDFKVIRAYSPLHNIKPGGHYPAVLITTSDHDDRVVPGHSFKYAATLQAAQGNARPVLIRIETRAGHGAGKPVTKTIDEWADRLAFLSRELAM
jgi:prolyl oligopeptidase